MAIHWNVKAVIYRNGGVLQNTWIHYEQAFCKIALEFGKTAPQWLLNTVKDIKIHNAVEVMIEKLGLKITHEKYKAKLNHLLIKLAPTTKMMPGAEDIVCRIGGTSIPQAMITSAFATVLDGRISNHHTLYRVFNEIITGDDSELKRSKSNIFLLAARRLGVHPSTCLVFSDTPKDIQIAKAAGMYTIGISQTQTGRKKLEDAHYILASLDEFFR